MSFRVFQTAWFAKASRRIGLTDATLWRAVEEAARGQADDLGGGVYKKRLSRNQHRAILLAKAGEFWVYVYLFAKQDRANIDDAELTAFRHLGALYRKKTDADLEAELRLGVLKEIKGDE
ncbi:type II toxin-antitoxin system RelE/ParE family toxin [Peteryoungia ipomoeae]|uniref:Type II toxin-antitoxin system RelE/ParE family toxin n=1 Tax=Peteryoungia ipomoeae TaxID=1210932 RepID=A0A4S8P3E4_9HYPH|nr:type II toxin-antitoxin system RelE/ParE family toxin [Peteryoungia ipomoeae]THV23402.1 type II toxin-antitoxin system RelE/ParE family toxin [Peteryoungia ipomoeae]